MRHSQEFESLFMFDYTPRLGVTTIYMFIGINISIVRNRIHDGGTSIGHESYSWFCVYYIRTIYTYIYTYSTWYSHDIPSAVDWIPWFVYSLNHDIPISLDHGTHQGHGISNSVGLPQSGWFLSWKIIVFDGWFQGNGFTFVNLHVFETKDRKVAGMMGIGLGKTIPKLPNISGYITIITYIFSCFLGNHPMLKVFSLDPQP